jgi:transposase InsO family protein
LEQVSAFIGIRNILRCHGMEPAPERGKKTSWAQFLKRHWEVMAATDMFTVESWSLAGMVRYRVFFVMRLATREVPIAGIADQPNGAWATQAVRNLCFLIHDRDPLFGTQFDQVLASSAIESVRLPSRPPNLNAYAERFVRSIKSECLDQMVFFSENSLRHAISEFAEHYHRERNHQGLDNRIIRPEFVLHPQHGQVRCRERLGGLLNYYYRQAA